MKFSIDNLHSLVVIAPSIIISRFYMGQPLTLW